MAFSGALTLTDLDDFLSPSQACILPVRQSNKVKAQEDGRDSGETEIHIDANNTYYEVTIGSTLRPSPSSTTIPPPSSSTHVPAAASSSSPLATADDSQRPKLESTSGMNDPTGIELVAPSSQSPPDGSTTTLQNGPSGVESVSTVGDSVTPPGSHPRSGSDTHSSENANGNGNIGGGARVGTGTGTGTAQQLQKAEISLNDCLACSGCVTSTESMLITLQSHLEVQAYIKGRVRYDVSAMDRVQLQGTADGRTGVLSISPQTLASLAASYFPAASTSTSSPMPTHPLTTLRLLRRIRHFLRLPGNGGWAGVWDTTFARHLSLIEHVREFKQRRAVGKGKAGEVGGVEGQRRETRLQGQGLPMLASACPGWVCYAEKAHGDLLPFMASTRSSQGIVGGLVKYHWAERRTPRGLGPEEIYHVTVMPCYDKKLEASRSDFYNEQRKTRDVDCVLTTGELEALLRERGFDPYASVDGEDEAEPLDGEGDAPYPDLLEHPGSSSGSYLQSLIDAIAAEHCGPTSVTTRQIRGSDDHVEYVLTDTSSGQVLFKGAKCYGFRNLQNLVRKIGRETGIKSGKGVGGGAGRLTAAVVARRRAGRASRAVANGGTETPGTTDSEAGPSTVSSAEDRELDYVEVMACPGGCVNGGGQMKPATAAPIVSTPADSAVDEEGFRRAWETEGVQLASTKPLVDESMRWSTKAWVAQVEEIYWSGLPTPPASPRQGQDRSEAENRKRRRADELAEMIIRDVCERPGPADADWDSERKRQEFLRTRYRKVESDITSLAAVKW